MKRVLRILPTVAVAAVCLQAQPKVNQGGVLNAASYAVDGSPGDGVPRGGILVIFGERMGPQALQTISAFPLPLVFPAGNGTSVRVTAGGAAYDCYMIYTSTGQVAAILPSATPAGAAKLRVTYNWQTSNEVDIKVVDRSFGIFTQTADGRGQASLQNFVGPGNTPLNNMWASALPESIGILWGTGLGAVTWDESGPPQAGNFTGVDLRVWVGGLEARVDYKGRSGSCAGLDQINFQIPRGIVGCRVPVAVQIGDRVSNIATISIAPAGGQCPELAGLAAAVQPSSGGASRSARMGTVVLSRSRSTVLGLAGAEETATLDSVGAGFTTVPVAPGVIPVMQSISGSPTLSLVYPAGCTVIVIPMSAGTTTATARAASLAALGGLDAGDHLVVTGPAGSREIPRTMLGETWFPEGFYTRTFGAIDTVTMQPSPLFVEAGAYTISAPGGTGTGAVGPFTASITLPSEVVWTNKGQTGPITRSRGQLVTWEGGDPDGMVAITGVSVGSSTMGTMTCYERASARQFTIPAYALLSMPAGEATPLLPWPYLAVSGYTQMRTFTSPGLDLGTVTGTSMTAKVLSYR